MDSFYIFLESLRSESNSLLIEAIEEGYSVIFESFKDAADSVISAIDAIKHSPIKLNRDSDGRYYIKLLLPTLGNVSIILLRPDVDNKGIHDVSNVYSYYIGSGNIELYDMELNTFAIHNDINKIEARLKSTSILNILSHELAHMYEVNIRNESNVNEQYSNMSDRIDLLPRLKSWDSSNCAIGA